MARVAERTILDATIACIVEKGYVGATTRLIAAAAGVNELTLFRRFGDKRNLVIAAVHAQISRFGMRDTQPTGDLHADLLRILEFYHHAFVANGRLILALIVEASRDPGLAAVIREPLTVLAEVEDLLLHYQKAGQLIVEPPLRARNALIGPVLAHALNAQLDVGAEAPAQPRELLEGFLRGHGSR
ncbi:hypothetical protein Asp14428_23240 [Actinoplanes sp. NBRC 14428]|nr:hypothetical protein Asp14428_23240 [Actinoplanes sp. NBRC 14428]